jgi:CubicO group peptidase (beta-lactamase class C family)
MRKRRKATAILTALGLALSIIINLPARAFPRQRPARNGAGEGRAESRGDGATARGAVGQGRALGVRLDKMVAEQVERLKVPGYAVAVIYRGETVLQNGYGFADIASGRRPDAQTVFGLASLTKSFTGLAIVMLVESHKLSLDDELGKYLDGLSPEYRRLTIRELATMTAGVPKNVAPGDLTWEQQIRKAQTERLASRPGSAYLYSNLSYRILGDVIEKVSGESYMEFLQRHVLDPLGMTQTGPKLTLTPAMQETLARDSPAILKNKTRLVLN